MSYPLEKKPTTQVDEPASPDFEHGQVTEIKEELEVFKKTSDGVDFRGVTWQRATLIFLKMQIATGVLGIPAAFGTLGAVGGALSVVGWQLVNTYTAMLLADFRNRHPQCHSLVDMCGIMWGRVGRELVGFMFVIAFILCTGSAITGISTGLNAMSEHGACTVWFSFAGTILVCMFSSIRTWEKMTWPLTLGFVSVMAGVLVVVIGVSFRDRPAAAPQSGPFELGFAVIAYPTFAAGMTASATIFISSSAGPGYIPVLAEMRNPLQYKKPLYINGLFVGATYLSFSMVVYYYCGTWIASPSLGSAGPLLKKIAYGIAFPSLIVSAGIFNNISAKYVFVRLLRKTKHLQSNSWQHWTTWIGCNLFFGFAAFIMAEAIPVFNYILSLAGSICFAPMSLIFPPLLWMHDHPDHYKGSAGQKALYGLHCFIALVGMFLVIGGTYGTAISIKESYSSTGVFSCVDNSNTVV